MKIQDIQTGMWVVACKKSLGAFVSYKDFLSKNPLGICKVRKLDSSRRVVLVTGREGNNYYVFAPEDLKEIKGGTE